MSSQGDKLIFSGPVGVGKTAAIAAISDIPPVSTDVAATDETLQRKETTTVAMDYGMLSLGDGQKVHLYGTPGQDRFDFMWEILTQKGIGLVLLLDNRREMILSRRPAAEIKKRAVEEGMLPLRQSALIKVLAGRTTLREINKVTFVD